jgi:hypothetical protein
VENTDRYKADPRTNASYFCCPSQRSNSPKKTTEEMPSVSVSQRLRNNSTSRGTYFSRGSSFHPTVSHMLYQRGPLPRRPCHPYARGPSCAHEGRRDHPHLLECTNWTRPSLSRAIAFLSAIICFHAAMNIGQRMLCLALLLTHRDATAEQWTRNLHMRRWH